MVPVLPAVPSVFEEDDSVSERGFFIALGSLAIWAVLVAVGGKLFVLKEEKMAPWDFLFLLLVGWIVVPAIILLAIGETIARWIAWLDEKGKPS